MAPKKKEAEEAPAKKVFPWHAKSVEECIQELGLKSDLPKTGLTTEEAKKRLEQYGPNKMSEKEKVTLLQRIWKQVANVLVGILVFVAVVSAVRAITSTTVENIVSNWLQVALIVFVIT
jgi:magnesium-transporting ATPase (P-type)